jgi:hypothetical protein
LAMWARHAGGESRAGFPSERRPWSAACSRARRTRRMADRRLPRHRCSVRPRLRWEDRGRIGWTATNPMRWPPRNARRRPRHARNSRGNALQPHDSARLMMRPGATSGTATCRSARRDSKTSGLRLRRTPWPISGGTLQASAKRRVPRTDETCSTSARQSQAPSRARSSNRVLATARRASSRSPRLLATRAALRSQLRLAASAARFARRNSSASLSPTAARASVGTPEVVPHPPAAPPRRGDNSPNRGRRAAIALPRRPEKRREPR